MDLCHLEANLVYIVNSKPTGLDGKTLSLTKKKKDSLFNLHYNFLLSKPLDIFFMYIGIVLAARYCYTPNFLVLGFFVVISGGSDVLRQGFHNPG